MNFLLVGTLLVVVLVVGVTSNTGESCSDGEVKQIDCNRCKCIKGLFSCTKRHCLTKREQPSDGCTPGETKKIDCNNCHCGQNGNWACTYKFCIRQKREDTCTDGEVKQIDCNRCKCINGVFSCTKRHCVSKVKRELSSDDCTPGETKKVECNNCRCDDKGHWLCTLRACLRKKREETCTPGESKKEDCNTCHCIVGNKWACTRRHCLKRSTRDVSGINPEDS